jgi:hypothetical protein
VLVMVVVPLVLEHLPDTEEGTQIVETVSAARSLCYHEFVRHLITGPVASSSRQRSLFHKADGEASFSVYEAGHPATELDQSFLLVFRTHHIVTIVSTHGDGTMSSVGYTGFSSI